MSIDKYLNLSESIIVISLNVGFGDCTIIQDLISNPPINILIDTRNQYVTYKTEIKTPKKWYLMRFLDALQITKLDLVVITHPHKDHFDGMNEIIDFFKVSPEKVWISEAIPSEPKEVFPYYYNKIIEKATLISTDTIINPGLADPSDWHYRGSSNSL